MTSPLLQCILHVDIETCIHLIVLAMHIYSNMYFCFVHCSPNLTWRDIQYLIAYTSNPDVLMEDDEDDDDEDEDDEDERYRYKWVTNGAGLKVSHSFGFGAIDAEAMVTRARYWEKVPEQVNTTIPIQLPL